MKLSSQEEFGLRCLLQLGRKGPGESLTIAELGQLEGLSAPNVAKIMRVLRRGGFVKSTRGQAGGYALSRPADQIIVGEILSALGGRLFDSTFCERHAGLERFCTHSGDCSIRPVLKHLQEAVDQVLGGLSLKNLLCTEQEMVTWVGPGVVPLPGSSRPA
jgi:Rrf2 family transcriptional regulator, iron-sulfur cluster assembly transcription factor